MVTVRVRYHNMLRRITGVGHETLTIPQARLMVLLEALADRHGPQLRAMLFAVEGDISSHLVIFCNERLVSHDKRDLKLHDGDELMLFPAISGGCDSHE